LLGGCISDYEVVGIFEVVVRAVFPFSYPKLSSTRIAAAGGRVAYEAWFEYSDEVWFVGRWSDLCGKNTSGQYRRATAESGFVCV
jgi:hypothetical protein